MKTPKTLASRLFAALSLILLPQCASSGPQVQKNYFQAVEIARAGTKELAVEAFQSACSYNSAAACHRLGKRVEIGEGVPILQGATDETSTEVILLFDPKQEVQVFLWDTNTDELKEAKVSTPTELPQGLGRVVQYRFDSLTLGTVYQLQVVGPAGDLIDARQLQTLEVTKKSGTFAVASGLDDQNLLQKTIWPEVLSYEPEVLFLLGGAGFVASPTTAPSVATNIDELWKRYTQNRRTVSLYRQNKLIPIYATWGEADYGQRSGDRNYRFKLEAKKIFNTFFGGTDLQGVVDHGPGVSSRLNAFGLRFFLLDSRSFRTPSSEKTGQTHFGVDQEAWLFTELFGDVPSFLLSADPFFGGYHAFDSYEGKHPESFKRFLKRLKAQNSPVVFVSGDRPWTEVSEIPTEILGYRTIELTTSSIHAQTSPSIWQNSPNVHQVEGVGGVNNYAVFRTEVAQGLTGEVRVFGPQKTRLFYRAIEVRKSTSVPR